MYNHIKFAYTGLRAFKGVYRPHLAKAMLLLNNALCMVISLTSKTLCFLGQPFNLLSKSSDCNCFSAITRPTHPFGQHSFEMSCYGNLIPTVRKSIFNLIFWERVESRKIRFLHGHKARGFRSWRIMKLLSFILVIFLALVFLRVALHIFLQLFSVAVILVVWALLLGITIYFVDKIYKKIRKII